MQLKPSAEEGLDECVTTIEFLLNGKEKINYDHDWINKRKRKRWLDNNNVDTSSHLNDASKTKSRGKAFKHTLTSLATMLNVKWIKHAFRFETNLLTNTRAYPFLLDDFCIIVRYARKISFSWTILKMIFSFICYVKRSDSIVV